MRNINKQEKLKQEYQNKKFLNNIKQYNCNIDIPLLEYLYVIMPKEAKNNVKTILKNHCVLVNGVVVTQYNYQLYKKDIITISKYPVIDNNKTKEKINKTKLDIIYEDNEFLVINKPCGLLSIESDKEKVNTCYKEALAYMMSKDKNARCFQVHRLDKETSGVLLFVKNNELKELLVKNWNTLVKTRKYIAVCDGILKIKEDTVTKYLLKDPNTNLMYDCKNKNKGEKAITKYKVIKTSKHYSLVDVEITTGKKNQIRVTFNDLGCPIIGDDKYGTPSNPLNRLGLHASQLSLIHPITKKRYTFKADIPNNFMNLF